MPTDSGRLLRLSLALALGGFGIGSGEFVIMGLMQRVATDLQVPVPDVGYAISSYALGVVVGAPLISSLAARVPRRGLLIMLMLVFAMGNMASALATDFWTFVGLRFLAGLPHGAYFGVAALVAASAAPYHMRARAVARVMSGLTIAILVGAPLATILFPADQAGFIVVALLLYHLFQLVVAAPIASRLAASSHLRDGGDCAAPTTRS